MRRVRTNTPLQALTTAERSRLLRGRARRWRTAPFMRRRRSPKRERSTIFRLATARRPSGGRAGAAPPLLSRPRPSVIAGDDAAAWTMVASVVLNLDETVTKE